GQKRKQFYGYAVNQESARDVYSKRRIIAVTELQIVEWHDYKHLDWISVRRDDDQIYKFKEGDFKRLRLQDIEDMLLLLVQGNLSNLIVEERLAFNVSLRMFTRSIVIKRRVKNLQLGVERYQKKLNLTKPDTFKPSCDDGKKVDEDPRKENECNDQEKEDNVNITNNVNTVGSIVNAVSTNEINELPFNPNMPALEDVSIFKFSNDDEDDDIVADINNMDITIQMDVKSAFLYEKINEEVYVCQTPGFEDSDFPDRVYKVEKSLYGLHQAPRAWYETLSTYLLDNGSQRGKIDRTLFIKRNKGDILLVQVYVEDIIFGSTGKELCNAFERLMHEKFQMSSIGELTFFLGLQVKKKNDGIFITQDKYAAKILKKFRFIKFKNASTSMETQKHLLKHMMVKKSCACARYQVNPKVSHLYAVKGIFRYLKGQLKLGIWYLKDFPFDLVAYIDSDYAGASLDRKSTTGGCQFLRYRLISWQCKKQTVVANSTKKAEYKPKRKITVVPQPSEPMEHVVDEAVYKELDDRLVRATTTASSLEVENDSGGGPRCQDTMGDTIAQTRFKNVSKLSNNSLLAREVADKEVNDEVQNVVEEVVKEVVKDINTAKLIVDVAQVSAAGKVNVASIATTKMFDRAFKRINIFIDFRTELVEGSSKRAGEELIQENEKEVAIYGIPLAVKSLRIVDWKIYKEGKKSYYQIVRVDGKSQMYMFFRQILKRFDREDLYKLVKVKFRSTRPVEDLDLLLWGDLKTMFEPHVEDAVWRKQQGYKVLEWKLYDSYRVHSSRMQSMHIYR
nr:putative ribonuclease H-like domain-containing protein [Tanacetum cinerariifolium]